LLWAEEAAAAGEEKVEASQRLERLWRKVLEVEVIFWPEI
jgi:hypothetical protein